MRLLGEVLLALSYRALIGAAIHAATWIATVIVVSALSSGMSASAAYGILTGWWAALYVGRLVSIGIEAAIPLTLGYAALGIVSVPLGWSWIYRDPPMSLSSSYVGSVRFLSQRLLVQLAV